MSKRRENETLQYIPKLTHSIAGNNYDDYHTVIVNSGTCFVFAEHITLCLTEIHMVV